MKLRLTLIDILAEVRDLRVLALGQRLLNVYDIDEKTFLLRLNEPGREKCVLLIESGTRLHTTRYARDKPKAPGPFAAKLRKHIRGKRLNGIDVVGLDRVVDLTFGFGDTAAHLIVELYDRGNVVLTDAAYNILALLRQYTLEAGPSAALPASAATSSKDAGAASSASKTAGGGGKQQRQQKQSVAPSAVIVDATVTGVGSGQRAGKTGRGQKAKGPLHTVAAATSLAAAAASAGVAPDSAGGGSSSTGGGAGAGVVRVAVRQRYAFTPVGAATAALVASWGGKTELAVAATDADTTADTSAATLATTSPTTSAPPITPSSIPAIVQVSNAGSTGSSVPSLAPGTQVQPQLLLPPPPIDLRVSQPAIVAALAAYLSYFESVKLAAMPQKQRKKVTIASALSTKGSGVDVFGPVLLEHAVASADLPGQFEVSGGRRLGGDAPLSALRPVGTGTAMVAAEAGVAVVQRSAHGETGDIDSVTDVGATPLAASGAASSASLAHSSVTSTTAMTTAPSTTASATASVVFSTHALQLLAASLCHLPALLRSIATERAPAVAFVEINDPVRFSSSMGPAAVVAGDVSAGATAAPAAIAGVLSATGGSVGVLSACDDVDSLGDWTALQARFKAAPVAAAAATAAAPSSVANSTHAASWERISSGIAAGSETGTAATDSTVSASTREPVAANDSTTRELAATTAAPCVAAPVTPAPAAAVIDDETDPFSGSDAQAPPDVPFTFVDFAPLLLAQYRSSGSRNTSNAADAASTTAASSSLLSELTAASAAAAKSTTATGTTSCGSDVVTGGTRHIMFSTFDALVDEYFSRLDVQKAKRNEATTKVAAAKRLDRLRESHAEAILALSAIEREAGARGRLIEACAPSVEAASLVVRSALEHSMQWLELEALVAAETAAGNPIARLITGMTLGKGTITMALRDESAAAAAATDVEVSKGSSTLRDESGTAAATATAGATAAGHNHSTATVVPPAAAVHRKPGGKGSKSAKAAAAAAAAAAARDPFTLSVEIDVFATAAANARRYYERAKAAKEKGARAAASTDFALKKAEKAAAETAAKLVAAASAARNIGLARRHAWFERFQWFISSECILVVAGRNAADNETLVKRYLRPQDAYVHADVHGAATVIVRHPSHDPAAMLSSPLPPLTLEQAGAFCVCLSSAWGTHVGAAAWWATAAQVTKTAPTGEYLPTGSFMVRGRKSFLAPVRLELGLVLLWKVDEGNVDRHMGDRYVRGSSSSGVSAAAALDDGSVGVRYVRGGVPTSTDVFPSDDAGSAMLNTSSALNASANEAAMPSAPSPPHSTSTSVSPAPSPPAAITAGDADAVFSSKSDEIPAAVTAETSAASSTAAPLVTAAPTSTSVLAANSAALSGGVISAYTRRLAKKIARDEGVDAGTALRLAAARQAAAATAAAASSLIPSSVITEATASSSTSIGGSASAADDEHDDDASSIVSAPPPTAAASAAGASAGMPSTSGASGATVLSQSTSTSGKAPAPSPISTSAKAPVPAPSIRGKRGQARRAKEKYADQDDEDRALAAAAVGHSFEFKPKAAAPRALQQQQQADGKSTSGKKQLPQQQQQQRQQQTKGQPASSGRGANTSSSGGGSSRAGKGETQVTVASPISSSVPATGSAATASAGVGVAPPRVRGSGFAASAVVSRPSTAGPAANASLLSDGARLDSVAGELTPSSIAATATLSAPGGPAAGDTAVDGDSTLPSAAASQRMRSSRSGGGGDATLHEDSESSSDDDEDDDEDGADLDPAKSASTRAGKSGAAAAALQEARLLASLVAAPLPDDILLHAVPMLCPYSVCLTAKYRVKLTPGPLKKGKAASAAISAWTSTAKAAGVGTGRERELLRALPENDVVGAVLGNVRVSAAAGGAATEGGASASSAKGSSVGGKQQQQKQKQKKK